MSLSNPEDGNAAGGRRGCLETYVSATGAKRTAFELMARETVPSVLRDVPYDKFDARIITEAAQKGDSLALEVFRCTAERLGRALANAVAITSSEAVFFFGGLAQAGELLLDRRAVTWRRICCLFTGAT